MTQMICRLDSQLNDVDLLCVEENEEIWKSISAAQFAQMVIDLCGERVNEKEKPRWIDRSILALSSTSALIRRNGHRQIVTYAGKAYQINFPNSIYLLNFTQTSIAKIEAYTFFRWEGVNTKLYRMPMPNMTGSAHMCIGTADRRIYDGDILKALDKILDAEYTHDHVDNLKKPTSTIKWFRMLRKGPVTKDMLKDQTPVVLGSLVAGGSDDA